MKANQIFLLTNLLAVLALSACANMNNYTGIDDVEIDAYYKVNADDLSLAFISGTPDKLDTAAWDKVVEMLPDDILKKQVVEYQVFTDGEDEMLAFVEPYEKDENKWAFGLDYEDAVNTNSDGFATTVVHEFAHILSLETEQVKREYNSCATLEVEEGCAVKGAYLNAFYNQFWQGQASKQHESMVAAAQDDEEKKQTLVEAFYNKQPNSFVTEYAATDPMEDFAETFAYFVLSDKVSNPTTLKDKKIHFFYGYPKLVEIRQHIRENTSVRM